MNPVEWGRVTCGEAQHHRTLHSGYRRGCQGSCLRFVRSVPDELRHEQFLSLFEYSIRLLTCGGGLGAAVCRCCDGAARGEIRAREQMLPEVDECTQCRGR